MTFVITAPCCNDASCAAVCPVNCIHPTPDEPEFATADMLYIDPDSCVDCGLCLVACPVSAIVPEHQLVERDRRFLEVSVDYYRDHRVDGPAAFTDDLIPLPPDHQMRVAIVGAGPAGFYAAEELLRHGRIRVDMFDRLPTPYGLVRGGVAPDHPQTKAVEQTLAGIAAHANFNYLLNVTVGRDVTHQELADNYHAVIYAVGAATEKSLGIPGEDLPGSVSGVDFVGWYNGHPDHAGDDYRFDHERAVVIGNGNVAIDIARMMLRSPDDLALTDAADHAVESLRMSRVSEVVLLARRGVAQAAYTLPELVALGDMPGIDVVIDPAELALDEQTLAARDAGTLDSVLAAKIALAEELSIRPPVPGNRRLVLRFLQAPTEIVGDSEVCAVRMVRTEYLPGAGQARVVATDKTTELAAGLVISAIGYRGQPVPGIPFDPARGVVPNENGRVHDSGRIQTGVYVTGWIKRGATGGVGVNRRCGQETARAVLSDYAAGDLGEPRQRGASVGSLLESRNVRVVDKVGWARIDAGEQAEGRASGRRRAKIVSIPDLLAVADGVIR
ncbi:putative ferredoxin--NADP(+) reductase [Gordonia effusa NBRC 100432]|uniref:ferredoxin--NADP(+) reductase n=1 Tax=Gordonia effusa NBRC 100432 TaxID=1077974 RepID=H0QWG8_9ACTN|nr:FAD-dependent oxidoreductase [Gordonia effusa]GAB17169.1 putative ferredoxin--NADP(+) reductase [Gordonia effusa NBRC 100432]